MKEHFSTKLSFAAVALAAVALTSCSDNGPDTVEHRLDLSSSSINYDSMGVWTQIYTHNPFDNGDFRFAHTGDDFGTYQAWYGFAPSAVYNTESQSYWYGEYQFSAVTGGGLKGAGTPFMMGFWNVQETADTPVAERAMLITMPQAGEADRLFTPQEVYVTNACVSYYTMRDGNDWTTPFKQGDWFKLSAYGVKADGTVTAPAEILLADCSGDDPDKWYVTEWTHFDLSGLGEVRAVYFTMSSSDTGEWGMNNPAYVAMDGLTVSTSTSKE